ncbi:non-ribosomal peptide synthetase [Streptomyces beijiangensis]|uniref:Non-ribosomal peptide synthetase n=1 Tax=Streptomyces beijiangensis TaxID=163361 RepID=A0A939F963_9ACTN|nr:non-ribosomal peptide synthetase [Streptomyces beijiangensis]MBO0514357.1 non-ribosomal peptide synthetase [Streptomyces beijiangensis]
MTGLFDRTVVEHPDRAAVSDGQRELSYLELSSRARALAAHLASQGVGIEDRVAINRPRSVDTFVSMIGILQSGAAYVSVDERYPNARRDLMIRDSGAQYVVTDPGGRERLAHLEAEGIEIVEWLSEPVDAVTRFPVPGVRPNTAACVLFTSGSTGSPKSFVLEHGNMIAFACNPAMPALSHTDRTSQIASTSFDAFHYEVWFTFAAGAHLVVMPSMPELLASDLQHELQKREISVMIAPTMAFNHLAHEAPETFAGLRILQVGGGAMLPSACTSLLQSDFTGSLWNLYGPSETTTGCSVHHVERIHEDEESVPIGRPLEGFMLYVLDGDRSPVPDGEMGELYIGGPGVARGYIGEAAIRENRFLKDPFSRVDGRMYASGDLVRRRPDGIYEYFGRIDEQVKIRGYRVEPGDVEITLAHHPQVHEVAVLVTGEDSDLRIDAFVAAAEGVTPKDVRDFAEAELPDYMIPSRIYVLAELPANESGKRDRDVLRSMLDREQVRAAQHRPAQTETEKYLAALWEKLLRLEAVGRGDDFFYLGGNSLLAFRVKRHIRRDVGVDVGFRTLTLHSTLSDLAHVIDGLKTDAV